MYCTVFFLLAYKRNFLPAFLTYVMTHTAVVDPIERTVLLISLTNSSEQATVSRQDTAITSPTPASWPGIILTAMQQACTDHKWCGAGEGMCIHCLLHMLFETMAAGGRRQDMPCQIQVLVFFPMPLPQRLYRILIIHLCSSFLSRDCWHKKMRGFHPPLRLPSLRRMTPLLLGWLGGTILSSTHTTVTATIAAKATPSSVHPAHEQWPPAYNTSARCW